MTSSSVDPEAEELELAAAIVAGCVLALAGVLILYGIMAVFG